MTQQKLVLKKGSVLVQPFEPKPSQLWQPDEKPYTQGLVIRSEAADVPEGYVVFFPAKVGLRIRMNDKLYLLMDEFDIYARIEDEA